MTLFNKFMIFAIVTFVTKTTAQENIFLSRDYWKETSSIDKIDNAIKAGNNPAELNSNAFDAISLALLEKVDNNIVKYLLTKKGNDVNKKTHDGRTYIFWAAYKNNLEMMKYLVNKGAKTNVIDSHGYSLLNFAAVTGQQNIDLYDFCIANGANPKIEKNHDGANALLLVAPFLENDVLLNYFIKQGISINTKDTNGNGIFNYAAKKGNIEILNRLIKKGVDYKTLNKEGGNAFILASQGTRNSSNTLQTYKYLETLGIQANITTDDGFTPLHALSYKNTNLEIFNYFIDKGVDVNQQDINGNTALINAAYRNDLASVAFLAKYAADINAKNKKGATCLMKAMQRNSIEVVQFLINEGASVSSKDIDNNTIAYYLLESFNTKKTESFKLKLNVLKEKGVNFKLTQAKGNTLWHLAVKRNNIELLKIIETLNIPINLKNKEGHTALHIAAMKASNTEILKFLLEKGADKTIQTEFDETALDLASENERLQKQNIKLNFLQ